MYIYLILHRMKKLSSFFFYNFYTIRRERERKTTDKLLIVNPCLIIRGMQIENGNNTLRLIN
jgi:hypothetical protein